MNPNAESYNRICDQWHVYRMQKRVNRCVAEFAALLKPASQILDVGCGTGYPIAAYLSGLGHKVTGIDISERMIECAKSQNLPNAEFWQEDLLSYQTEKRFDAVIAFDSLWHIPLEQQPMIYGIIGQLLQPGGYLLFTHGKTNSEVNGEMFGQIFHYSSLDASAVRTLLYNNGLSVLDFIENYAEETTGDRELLVVARKAE